MSPWEHVSNLNVDGNGGDGRLAAATASMYLLSGVGLVDFDIDGAYVLEV